MPGTFSPPLLVSNVDMHHDGGWRGNIPGIPGACAILKFTYLVRGPYYESVGAIFRAPGKRSKRIFSGRYYIGCCTGIMYIDVNKRSIKYVAADGMKHSVQVLY